MPPKPFARALADLTRELGVFGSRWYLFGAQAAIFYGSARATQDIDVTVEAGPERATSLVEALSSFHPRVPASTVAELASRTRVVPLVHASTAIPVDVVLAGPGLEELFLDRRLTRRVAGVSLPIASAEDIVLMKLIAGRPTDLQDAAAIVRAQPGLDRDHVRTILAMLEPALERSDLIASFEALR